MYFLFEKVYLWWLIEFPKLFNWCHARMFMPNTVDFPCHFSLSARRPPRLVVVGFKHSGVWYSGMITSHLSVHRTLHDILNSIWQYNFPENFLHYHTTIGSLFSYISLMISCIETLSLLTFCSKLINLTPGMHRLQRGASAKVEENFPLWVSKFRNLAPGLENRYAREKFFFFFKFLEDMSPILWGHWYLCFGLLVISPLGFKARVGSLIRTLWRHTFDNFPEIHLWCYTCQSLGSRHGSWADLFHIPVKALVWLKRETSCPMSERSTDWAMPARLCTGKVSIQEPVFSSLNLKQIDTERVPLSH